MWKNILELLRPQMCIAGWKPKATNTLIICKTYFFSTATMVA